MRLATAGASSLTRLSTVFPPYAKSPNTTRVSLELLMSRKEGLVCFSSLLRSHTRTLASVDCFSRVRRGGERDEAAANAHKGSEQHHRMWPHVHEDDRAVQQERDVHVAHQPSAKEKWATERGGRRNRAGAHPPHTLQQAIVGTKTWVGVNEAAYMSHSRLSHEHNTPSISSQPLG